MLPEGPVDLVRVTGTAWHLDPNRECNVAMREGAVRTLGGLFAVSWLVLPGFGLIDLSVTWNPDWPQVLEAGWGLFSSIVVGTAFLLVAARPRATAPAVAQLVVAIVSLVLSAAIAREGRLLWFVAFLAIQTAIVARLSRPLLGGEGPDSIPGPKVSKPLLLLAGLGAGPWFAYALQMWELSRQGRPGDTTLGLDHYSVQGALALALAVLSLSAALRPRLCPFVPACVGIAAAYLGLVCTAWQDSAGSPTLAWSIAETAWGLALLAVIASRRFRAPLVQPQA